MCWRLLRVMILTIYIKIKIIGGWPLHNYQYFIIMFWKALEISCKNLIRNGEFLLKNLKWIFPWCWRSHSRLNQRYYLMHPLKLNNFWMKYYSVKCFVAEIYVCHADSHTVIWILGFINVFIILMYPRYVMFKIITKVIWTDSMITFPETLGVSVKFKNK